MPHLDTSAPRASVDLDACVALMRTGSRTFFAASRLLPVRVRASSIALYAFCRVADDMVDGGEYSLSEAMALLSQRLDAIYAGDPHDHVEDRALEVGVAREGHPLAVDEGLVADGQRGGALLPVFAGLGSGHGGLRRWAGCWR